MHYCLARKRSCTKQVLEIVKEAVDQYHVAPCKPVKMMTDFKLAIINAYTAVFPGTVSGCYFHFSQIIYRRVQGDGLQDQYSDPLDRTVKWFTHMLVALAFIPEANVANSYAKLHRVCPQVLHNVFYEFNKYFISGRPG